MATLFLFILWLILSPLTVLLKLLLGGLLLWVAWEGMRKDHAGAWLAMPAVGLVIVSLYQQELLVLHVPLLFFPFGLAVGISQIAVVVSLNMITILLMRRFLQSLKLRQQWEAEIDQARQIQQLLIPEAIPTIPGYVLETEYKPAQQVGGDFFQILPDGHGGVLILLGDVTGKGLQAGMQVALIVGAIRTIVETSYEPHVVLEALNRRLCGRGQSYATCVAMQIAADGKTIIANAGHLAPYLNGKELTMTGNLPLGLNPSITFDQVTIQLKQKDRLSGDHRWRDRSQECKERAVRIQPRALHQPSARGVHRQGSGDLRPGRRHYRGLDLAGGAGKRRRCLRYPADEIGSGVAKPAGRSPPALP